MSSLPEEKNHVFRPYIYTTCHPSPDTPNLCLFSERGEYPVSEVPVAVLKRVGPEKDGYPFSEHVVRDDVSNDDHHEFPFDIDTENNISGRRTDISKRRLVFKADEKNRAEVVREMGLYLYLDERWVMTHNKQYPLGVLNVAFIDPKKEWRTCILTSRGWCLLAEGHLNSIETCSKNIEQFLAPQKDLEDPAFINQHLSSLLQILSQYDFILKNLVVPSPLDATEAVSYAGMTVAAAGEIPLKSSQPLAPVPQPVLSQAALPSILGLFHGAINYLLPRPSLGIEEKLMLVATGPSPNFPLPTGPLHGHAANPRPPSPAGFGSFFSSSSSSSSVSADPKPIKKEMKEEDSSLQPK